MIRCLFCASPNVRPYAAFGGSGVFAPDGGEEMLYEEGWKCGDCGGVEDAVDLVEELEPMAAASETAPGRARRIA